jgi:hypothetical protein
MVGPKPGKDGSGPKGGGVKGGKKPDKPKPKPSKTVANRASKTVQKRNGGGGGNRMFGGMGGFQGVDQRMVRQLINQTVRPEMMAMRDDRQFINRQADDALSDANTAYQHQVSGINNIFNTAGQQVAGIGQQIQSGYQNLAGQVAGNDAAAQGQIDANASAAQQAIAAQLANAGITGLASPDPSIAGDAAFAKSIAAQQGANNQTNIGMQQQSAATLSGLLGGMIQGSRASGLAGASQEHATGVNDINRAKREDLASVTDAMQQLRATKPGMIREMLLQLQAQGFDQWSALQNLNMQRKQMNHGMSMDRAAMNEEAAYYGTSAQAWGSQASSPSGSASNSWSPGTSSTPLAGPASNPSWTPNPPKGGPKGGTKPGKGKKGGRKGNGGAGGRDAIHGPLY